MSYFPATNNMTPRKHRHMFLILLPSGGVTMQSHELPIMAHYALLVSTFIVDCFCLISSYGDFHEHIVAQRSSK